MSDGSEAGPAGLKWGRHGWRRRVGRLGREDAEDARCGRALGPEAPSTYTIKKAPSASRFQ